MRRARAKAALTAGLALVFVLALGTALRARRPDILSQGTIAFASAGLTALAAAAVLIILGLRSRPLPRLLPLDFAVLALPAWSWASYLLSPAHRGPAALAFLPVTGLSAYLLVRAAGARLLRPKGGLLAGLFVGLAGAQAAQGFTQFLAGREVRGFFFNTNHLAMFLSMALPAGLALAWSGRTKAGRLLAWASIPVFILLISLSRCRSAFAAGVISLGLMVAVRVMAEKTFRRRAVALFGAGALLVVALLALSLKPASTVGRILTWRVSARVFLTHPVLGTGFTTFPGYFNRAQGELLGTGAGSSAERLSAGAGTYAFNDFLETAVELGIPGLALLVWLWVLVVRTGFRAFRGAWPKDTVAPAAAAIPAVYFVLSLFYYPSRILPIGLVFYACLAWLANLVPAPASGAREGANRAKPRPPEVRAAARGGFGLVAGAPALACLALALGLLPAFFAIFKAERTWSGAMALDRLGERTEAAEACRPLVRRLEDNANFLVFYGRLLTELGQAAEAARVLDTPRPAGTSPFVLEKRALALARGGRLDAAFACASDASRMLPWRLTPKVLLAEIGDRLKAPELASAFAFAALVTPLKIRTDEGTALKKKAFDIWKKNGAKGPDDLGDRLTAVLLLPSEYQAECLAALETAGDNAAELVLAVSLVKPDERPGLAFLLANMPDEDLRSLKARFLVENVRLAYRARRNLPWAADVPEDIFLNDILAYSVANESRDSWRPEFFARFAPVVALNPPLEDAVFNLNLGLISQFQLIYKERDNRGRILGPFETIRSGTVSCGEGSMLLAYACRAAGIPARLAVLGRWAHLRMGHIWVEVYGQGGWHRLTCYDVGRLDRTWMEPYFPKLELSDPRQHILASSYRRTGLHNVFGPAVSFVDVTHAYKK
jgi:hypothetical protein